MSRSTDDGSVIKRRIATVVLITSFLVVLVSVLLPNTTIAWMRNHWPWFNQPMLWIEDANSALNLVHAVLFLVLGIAVRLALQTWRLRQVALGFLMLGATTEWVQFLVPGRHPRMDDVLVDVVAGLVGWFAACVVLYAGHAKANAMASVRQIDR